MKSMSELEEYIEKTEDNSLGMIVDVVKEFGNKLPSLINQLKSHHMPKEEAEVIFSTVHRCKGMEYDEVTLLNDFINEEKVKRNCKEDCEKKMNQVDKNKLAEEINILYVAATRAKNKLILPADINPLRSIGVAQPEPKVSITSANDFSDYRDKWNSHKNKYNSSYFDYSKRDKYKRWRED